MAILIVDDSEISRQVIKKALEFNNYKDIILAEDGIDALNKLTTIESIIKLFIFDINMPNMDGLTLLMEVKKLYKNTPVLMLTTESDKAKMIMAKEFGASGWIIKPFQADKFIKAVSLLLNEKNM
jgi:two-component system, chemotaxis family, chemotaxis protein CheY